MPAMVYPHRRGDVHTIYLLLHSSIPRRGGAGSKTRNRVTQSSKSTEKQCSYDVIPLEYNPSDTCIVLIPMVRDHRCGSCFKTWERRAIAALQPLAIWRSLGVVRSR